MPSAADDPVPPSLEWRGEFTNAEANRLHAECFEHEPTEDDWRSRVDRFSLGWVCMRSDGELVGFVNVAWDGGAHAFILDTIVSAPFRRSGHAARLVAEAARHAAVAGCEWLHADFEPHLRGLYVEACGFTATDAGLIRLPDLA